MLAPLNRGEISVERTRGGGFNRIIGISVASIESPTFSQYILRTPRFETTQPDHDLAPLQLLRQRSKLRVPQVVHSGGSILNNVRFCSTAIIFGRETERMNLVVETRHGGPPDPARS